MSVDRINKARAKGKIKIREKCRGITPLPLNPPLRGGGGKQGMGVEGDNTAMVPRGKIMYGQRGDNTVKVNKKI